MSSFRTFLSLTSIAYFILQLMDFPTSCETFILTDRLRLGERRSNMKLEVITREPETDARPTPVLFVHGMFHGAWCWDEHFLPYFAQHG